VQISLRPSRSAIALATLLLGISALLAQAPAKSQKPAPAGSSSLTNGLYRNFTFGFSYKLPYGWVDRTQDMQDVSPDPAHAQVLLTAFERPPGTAGDAVDSAVVISAESASTYKDAKTAADYFGPLTEVAKSKGFKVVQEPYDFPAGGKQLVRSDFSKGEGKTAMYQTSLVMLSKGSFVCFTFITGTPDEADSLIENLSFSVTSKAPNPTPKK
jgi:hypothetical protein